MSNPTTKLTVIKDDTTYTCQAYELESDATPSGGSALPIKIGDVDCYLGLLTEASSKTSPLRVIKDGVTYYIALQGKEDEDDFSDGEEYIIITVTPSAHETIIFKCNGITANINTDSGARKLKLPVGKEYSFEVTADDGYVAGTISGMDASGTIAPEQTGSKVTVTAASSIDIVVTITQPKGATINVTCGNSTYTSTFTGTYGSKMSFALKNESYSSGGTIKVNDSEALPETLTEALTVTADGITLGQYTISLVSDGGADVTMKVGQTEIKSGDQVEGGSTLNVTATAKDGYSDPVITIS